MAVDKLGGKKTLNVGGFLNEFEKDDIKKEVDIITLFGHFGVRLVKKGKSWVSKCPWHDDKTPSLSVDKEKGLYNCFGCGESGDVFSLVQKMKGCDFKEALQFLKGNSFKSAISATYVTDTPKKTTGRQKKEEKTMFSGVNLDIVCDFYHKKLYENSAALAYITKTRKIKPELISRFKIGYTDGSLLKIISNGQKEIFKTLGILKTSDKGGVWEHFTGCITFPVFDESGRVVHFYGRKVAPGSEIAHLYLSGSHKSVFNRKASKVYDTIILTESVIDCLSLISLGMENVQPLYGVGVLTDEHLQLLKADRVKTVILAFDNDKAGEDGVGKHKKTLLDKGFSIKVITPPEGKDWNDCLLSGVKKEDVLKLIDDAEAEQPKDGKIEFTVKKEGIKYIFTMGEITYRLTGVKELFTLNLRVQIKSEYQGKPHWDGVDLTASKSRTYYSNKLAEYYDIESKVIEKHLITMLEYLEDERDKKYAELQGMSKVAELSEEDKKLGMDFLKSPGMFKQIISDMETLGYVGEDLNKQLLYIAASSRKLENPISILIISSSSAGKSYLVDTVKHLMPEEDVMALTSLSDQALNYIPDGGLLHKFLILGEAVHSDIIEHQIRDMLSDHRLSRIVTVKDEKTGKMTAETLTSECIVALVMSTTRCEINPENASRCFLINADETLAQTKKIHEHQRNKYSLARHFAKKHTIPQVKRKHKAAQRLLRNIIIVNPFGKYLDFPAQLIRTRRDNDRFMDLIACTCFLRQYQKEVKKKIDEITGDAIEYIECDLADYEIAYNIMVNGVLSSTFAELPESLVMLYEEVRELFRQTAVKHNLKALEVTLTQKDIREKVKWMGRESIKKGLRKLVYLEYLAVTKGKVRGMRNSYSLVADEPVERLDCTMIPPVLEIKRKMKEGG